MKQSVTPLFSPLWSPFCELWKRTHFNHEVSGFVRVQQKEKATWEGSNFDFPTTALVYVQRFRDVGDDNQDDDGDGMVVVVMQ